MSAEHWRLNKQRYGLEGEVCRSEQCQDNKIFPPRDICPDCGEEAKDIFKFSGRGTVYSHTTVYQAPSGHKENAPYPVAIIKLEEGTLVTAQLTDLDPDQPIEIGTPVEMVTRKLTSDGERGQLVYGYKFRPLLEGSIQSE